MPPDILLSHGPQGPSAYAQAVRAAGGISHCAWCPPCDTSFDALVLCGGGDVDPARFGQENRGSRDIDHRRDTAELALARAYAAAGKPILAICRGCQVVNIALGGTLIQDLPPASRQRHTSQGSGDLVHPVTAEPGSFFFSAFGPRFFVNSAHHQAVDLLGAGLLAALKSDDGVVEGLVHRSLPILCVQFHPERMSFSRRRSDTADGAPFFHWLLHAAAAQDKI